jgi:DNA-binding NtrC family response regulator
VRTLLVDDDGPLLNALLRMLRQDGWDVDAVNNAAAALERLDGFDLLVADIRMPGMNGLELLREARRRKPGIQTVLMTAYGSIPSAIEAMREGARGYLAKPFESEELLAHMRAVRELLALREAASRGGRGDLVGTGRVMRRVYAELDIAASAGTSPVLLTGESGTGKNLAAETIHANSARRSGPFITVNLGALPRDLVEGELFGHEKGAFTGAQAQKLGRFALADKGTLFLDEVDALPTDLQPKLLRAVEKKEIWPLGSEKPRMVDVRIVAATNADIEARVKSGAFREDLYYRLNVLRIRMPALREHPEDIPQIVLALLDRVKMHDPRVIADIAPEALSYMVAQPWRGNVRELSNALERALVCAWAQAPSDGAVTRKTIGLDAFIAPGDAAEPASDLSFRKARVRAADRWAKEAIEAAMAASKGNVSEVARQLQINRTALIRLMNRLGIGAVK